MDIAGDTKAITLGHPSYVWRAGQERRLTLIQRYVPLHGRAILDVGCGLGLYVRRLNDLSDNVHGVDIDPDKVAQTSESLANIHQGSAEALPYPNGTFDVVLSNEVIEHVHDDQAAIDEAYRVLVPGGHLVVFCPNRGYLFETHGFYWRGVYHFGNIPLVNYFPNGWRNRLAPHVRAYSRRQLAAMFAHLDGETVVHRVIFAGYDNIVAQSPRLGSLLRRVTYALERTPLQDLGLSHMLVFQKAGASALCKET